MKCPHIPLYTGDWMKDTELSLCTPATRGVWIDLLCAMHERNRSGELRGTSEQLARLARCSTVELVEALTDLQTTGAAIVEERNGSYWVANRRMQRESATREKRAVAGSKGGSKTSANREQMPDTDNDIDCCRVIEEFAESLGLPGSDGTSCFHKWQGNGWTNSGKPIRDWRATIRAWKLSGYLPSQKQGSNGTAKSAFPPRQMSAFEIKERVQAVNDEIDKIFKSAPMVAGYREPTPEQAAEIAALKEKRDELKANLSK